MSRTSWLTNGKGTWELFVYSWIVSVLVQDRNCHTRCGMLLVDDDIDVDMVHDVLCPSIVSYSHEKENFKSLLLFKVYKIASTPIIPAFFPERSENTLVEYLYFQRSESTRYTPGIEPEAETIIPRRLFRLGLRFHRRKENVTREDIRCGMRHAHIALSSSSFTNCTWICSGHIGCLFRYNYLCTYPGCVQLNLTLVEPWILPSPAILLNRLHRIVPG